MVDEGKELEIRIEYIFLCLKEILQYGWETFGRFPVCISVSGCCLWKYVVDEVFAIYVSG